ncbi:hypothetical protein FZ983_33100 [Azospirillum sp. B21]|uniref:hypothetical protein n=1 Tax=Azospirillum sp. B21 TaxID=2607496 RepID=UPI0011F02E9A|nr:hypothetical protein [Azospirillum sp. B21]KAA0571657.1 hypothetical protein FZ983_33100 [Azospirillum sp. B21]
MMLILLTKPERTTIWHHQNCDRALIPCRFTVLIWHVLTKQADYHWARPALQAAKRRALQLLAGQPIQRGRQRGMACAYNLKSI